MSNLNFCLSCYEHFFSLEEKDLYKYVFFFLFFIKHSSEYIVKNIFMQKYAIKNTFFFKLLGFIKNSESRNY